MCARGSRWVPAGAVTCGTQVARKQGAPWELGRARKPGRLGPPRGLEAAGSPLAKALKQRRELKTDGIECQMVSGEEALSQLFILPPHLEALCACWAADGAPAGACDPDCILSPLVGYEAKLQKLFLGSLGGSAF